MSDSRVRGAEEMLAQDLNTVPYHNEGRGGTEVGGSWPQGHPGESTARKAPAGTMTDLLREVLRSPKAYRGIKRMGADSRHTRYTAIEISDDLAGRIAAAVVSK